MSEESTNFAAAVEPTNGAGIPLTKLKNKGTGAAMHQDKRKLHAKHPSSLAKRLKAHGVDWVGELACAIKAFHSGQTTHTRMLAREDVRMWLRVLPYMVTGTNKVRVKKWKGKASKAAIVALEALEGREDA